MAFPLPDRVSALQLEGKATEALAVVLGDGVAEWAVLALHGQAFYPVGMNRLPVGYNGCT